MWQRLAKIPAGYALAVLLTAILFTILGGNLHIGAWHLRLTHLLIIYVALELFYGLDARLSIGVALGLLGVIALLSITKDEARANWAAEAAYTFLVLGIMWQIAELVAERRQTPATVNERVATRRRGLLVASFLVIILAVAYGPATIAKLSSTPRPAKINQEVSSHAAKRRVKEVMPASASTGTGAPAVSTSTVETTRSITVETTTSISAETTSSIEARNVTVLNGNGRLGAAAKIALQLKEAGVSTITVGNAERIYNQSEIRFNPADMLSSKLAQIVSQKYQPILIQTPTLPRGSLVVILGLK